MINVKKIVDWRKLLSFSAAGLTVASLTDSVVGASNSVEPLKPNIIIIQTDDQGYNDLSCYGSKNIRTPHIDSMALNGVKFTDYYCPAPVCSPSRAGLLTGTYPARLGFGGLALYPGIPQGLNPNEVTIAEMLKTMGYTTACVGKWHVGGNKMTTQDKDLLVYHPLRNGFDSFYGFYSNGTWVTPLVREYTEVGPTDSSKITNQLTVEAVSVIKANKSKPFFMYMNHFMPHTPIGASLLFVGTSTIGIYGDAVHEVDWSVGQIIKTLREEGIENNTLIIFTSDNGPAASGSGSAYPLRGGKFDALEGGQRVPCVMQWPAKIPAGTVCRQIASAIDFLPTIAAFTGATLPNDRVIDGKNMYSLMTGVPGAISSYDTCGFFYNDSNFRPIRRGKWKYSLVWADKRLYDLTDTNPEVINRSKTYPALCAELDSMSKAHWKDMLETNYRPLGNTDSMKVSSERSITGNYTRQNRVTDSYYYTVHGRRIPVAQINSAPNGIYMIRTANGVKRKIILR